jgi:hypothetical protein
MQVGFAPSIHKTAPATMSASTQYNWLSSMLTENVRTIQEDDDEYDEEEYMALKKEQGNVYMTALYASIILAGAYVVGKALKKYK